MSAAPAPLLQDPHGPAVTTRLRALAATSAWTGAVQATRAYRLAAVQLPSAVLVIPLVGTKRVHLGGESHTGLPGDAVMLHDRVAIDTENLPGEEGRFVAISLFFPERVLASVRALVGAPLATPGEARVTICPLAPLEPAIAALLGLPPDAPPLAADHALAGVAIALMGAGHGRFLAPRPPRLVDRVRDLVASAPARPWAAAEVEAAMHLSGATLRRHLAAEGTSLRRLITEVRLHTGLGMLQTTRSPLKAVAWAAGYRSVASFRAQFRARFGVEPSAVRAGPTAARPTPPQTPSALADAAGGV